MEKTILNSIKKKAVIPAMGLILSFSFAFTPVKANAQIYYQVNNTETISKGIIYEKSTQVGESGLLDVHVLTVDITNPDIEVKPIWPENNYGAKETVLEMVGQSGALAGINGELYDMELSPGTPFGTVVSDGKVISLDEEYSDYATFFIDDGNNPFIEYVQPDVKFLNNGEENIKVHAMNKFKRDFSAIYFDRTAFVNTAVLDAKFPDLVKIVVSGGYITYISKGGETVEIPENGYIIMLAATYAQYFYNSVKVGDTAEIQINARFDFDAIQTAVGGIGKILENGSYSNYGYVVGPNSRNPRTAMGVSQDKTKVIMVCVDGRNHSVGATHAEMADILLRYGAWNAMHLDGGGSTTMVVDSSETGSLDVVNTPSGNSLRKVVNGVGVFNSAPLGETTSLNISLPSEKIFAQSPVTVTAFGLDSNLRRTALPSGEIQYFSDDLAGSWADNVFYPSQSGFITVAAAYNGFLAEKKVEVMQLAQINPNKESLKLSSGDSYQLSFTGISTSGISAPLAGISYEVVPAELGDVTADGVFTAKTGTSGYIKCYIGNVAAYIDVSIGTELRWVTSFNNTSERAVEFLASSDGVSGKAYYTDTPNSAGNYALALEYAFSQSGSTQAAYLQFVEPIEFSSGINNIVISVYGMNNGGWLRARVTDINGDAYLIDLAKDFNYTGWSQLKGTIPDEAAQPVKLDRLYIAALSNTDTSNKVIYFDDLGGLYPANSGVVQKPLSTTFTNPYTADLSGAASNGAYDITITGNITPQDSGDYASVQNAALQGFKKDTSYMVYLGETDTVLKENNNYIYDSNYSFTKIDNYALIQLSAAKGSISLTNPQSWAFVSQALASPAEHIIILLDKKPSNFSNTVEYELFQTAAEQIRASGKTVFVVSTENGLNSAQYIDGVSYINLAGLFTSDNSVNPDFSYLRLRINGGQITYQLIKGN